MAYVAEQRQKGWNWVVKEGPSIPERRVLVSSLAGRRTGATGESFACRDRTGAVG